MKIKSKLIIALFSTVIFSQFSNAQYFAEVNLGLNGSIYPKTNTLSHAGLGFGFIHNNSTLGAKVDFAMDQFRTTVTGKETGSDFYRLSLQALCNISNLIDERSYNNNLNVLVHSGFGYSLGKPITQKKVNDHIINVIMGITPKYKLTENLSLTLDASLLFNIAQSYQLDVDYSVPQNKISPFTGTTYTTSIGILYAFKDL